MRIKETLAQWLEHTQLFEMAYSRQTAWKIVHGLATPLFLHIAKILLMPESLSVIHWSREIHAWLSDIAGITLKPQNRRLSFNEYKEWLINQPEPTMAGLIKYVQQEFPSEKFVISNRIEVKFQRILLSMCHDLANNSVKKTEQYFNDL